MGFRGYGSKMDQNYQGKNRVITVKSPKEI